MKQRTGFFSPSLSFSSLETANPVVSRNSGSYVHTCPRTASWITFTNSYKRKLSRLSYFRGSHCWSDDKSLSRGYNAGRKISRMYFCCLFIYDTDTLLRGIARFLFFSLRFRDRSSGATTGGGRRVCLDLLFACRFHRGNVRDWCLCCGPVRTRNGVEMVAMNALDALLAAASRACCSSLAIFIQIQVCTFGQSSVKPFRLLCFPIGRNNTLWCNPHVLSAVIYGDEALMI